MTGRTAVDRLLDAHCQRAATIRRRVMFGLVCTAFAGWTLGRRLWPL